MGSFRGADTFIDDDGQWVRTASPDAAAASVPVAATACATCGQSGVIRGGWLGSKGDYFCSDCWASWRADQDPDDLPGKLSNTTRGKRSAGSNTLSLKGAWSKGALKRQRQEWMKVWEEWERESTKPWDVDIESEVLDSLVEVGFSDAHCHLDYLLQNKVNGLGWISRKRICCWWEVGNCWYGDLCDFAHGEDMKSQRVPIVPEDLLKFTEQHRPFRSRPAATIDKFVGVRFLIHNCCEVESIDDTLLLLQESSSSSAMGDVVRVTFGCHPHNYRAYDNAYEAKLVEAANKCGNRLVAWGECGLDYHKNYDDAANQERRAQMLDVFERQAVIAVDRGLPLVVHTRDADKDTLEVLWKAVPREHPVHIHAFQGTQEFMWAVLKDYPQAVIGVSGNVAFTYPYADAVNVARYCPLDRLVLETDSPFLSSEPRSIPWLAVKVAEIRGSSPEEVLAAANTNCERFYRLHKSEAPAR